MQRALRQSSVLKAPTADTEMTAATAACSVPVDSTVSHGCDRLEETMCVVSISIPTTRPSATSPECPECLKGCQAQLTSTPGPCNSVPEGVNREEERIAEAPMHISVERSVTCVQY